MRRTVKSMQTGVSLVAVHEPMYWGGDLEKPGGDCKVAWWRQLSRSRALWRTTCLAEEPLWLIPSFHCPTVHGDDLSFFFFSSSSIVLRRRLVYFWTSWRTAWVGVHTHKASLELVRVLATSVFSSPCMGVLLHFSDGQGVPSPI